jgi:hypothetical protein
MFLQSPENSRGTHKKVNSYWDFLFAAHFERKDQVILGGDDQGSGPEIDDQDAQQGGQIAVIGVMAEGNDNSGRKHCLDQLDPEGGFILQGWGKESGELGLLQAAPVPVCVNRSGILRWIGGVNHG